MWHRHHRITLIHHRTTAQVCTLDLDQDTLHQDRIRIIMVAATIMAVDITTVTAMGMVIAPDITTIITDNV